MPDHGVYNVINQGIKVTAACSTINFILGSIYAWSVFANGLIKELGWSKLEAASPFTLDIFVFSAMMFVAGRLQDIVGPRAVVTIGGILSGLGFVFCSASPTPISVTVFFGLLFGAGSAFSYASVTPAAIKWYPKQKWGLITGLVVMSQGAAALVWPPVINSLILQVGTVKTFLVWGIFLIITVSLMAQLISIPQDTVRYTAGEVIKGFINFNYRNLIFSPTFFILWLTIGLSIGTSHMMTAHLVQITELNFKIDKGYLFISLFALFNTIGRLGGGLLADKVGYLRGLKAFCLLLAASMVVYLVGDGWPALVVATVILGFNTGCLFTVFPTTTAGIWGLQNFGLNYGLLFTAVGVGGALGPFMAGYLADLTGSYDPAFILGLLACSLAFSLTFAVEKTIRKEKIAHTKN